MIGWYFSIDTSLARLFRLASVWLLPGLIGACVSPQQQLDALAKETGFESLLLEGAGFRHQAYHNRSRDGRELHVYLEGDGSPWRDRFHVALDPTPRQPLALRLMALDPRPSLYLGRPCYHGRHAEPGCAPHLWTLSRYGPAVVDSLVSALDDYRRRHPFEQLVLIGYSGGGVLALLMAERLPEVRLVVTVAANLDTRAWSRYHDYTPLLGSLDPARRTPLNAGLPQWHLLGGIDSIVPPETVAGFLAARPCARVSWFPDFDHGCCWPRIWPEYLRRFADYRPLPGCAD